MPRLDGTGPAGKCPGSGRGRGVCGSGYCPGCGRMFLRGIAERKSFLKQPIDPKEKKKLLEEELDMMKAELEAIEKDIKENK